MNQPQPVKDASPLYEVERRAQHAARPGFRITELQLSATQKVPWHTHTHVSDTFYVLDGDMRLFLQDPKEEVNLKPGEVYVVRPKRPHLVTNGGGPASRDLTFYLPTGAGYTLVTVLTIEVLDAEPGTNRALTVNCRAHQEDGLHAVDMSIRQAEDYFCNSPAARAIWPNAERVQIKRWGVFGN